MPTDGWDEGSRPVEGRVVGRLLAEAPVEGRGVIDGRVDGRLIDGVRPVDGRDILLLARERLLARDMLDPRDKLDPRDRLLSPRWAADSFASQVIDRPMNNNRRTR